jgi:hypothetical protein
MSDEWRDDKPDPTDQLSDFLPLAKKDNFQLGKCQHRKARECGAQIDDWHSVLIARS